MCLTTENCLLYLSINIAFPFLFQDNNEKKEDKNKKKEDKKEKETEATGPDLSMQQGGIVNS